VWRGKYALQHEKNPVDMHKRLAKNFASVMDVSEEEIFNYLKDFKYIIPQGSVMSMLGSDKIGSLSNCFVVGQPYDSYGGIFEKDQQLAQLMKRRGGVGIDISTLRPNTVPTSNAAGTSTGAVSFMERFSNTTREVAQNGRRGALMISIDCRHPDVFNFATIKSDLTKVTGANISIQYRDDFMESVDKDDDYILRFPCEQEVSVYDFINSPYNELIEKEDSYFMRIRAKELWDLTNEQAHARAEPGIMYINTHWDYSPDTVYERYKGVTTNPCFHPDTLIETEYGRLKISDINKPMRVYSMDSDGRLVMSNASPAFVSKKNAKTLKITLKSGSSIQVTPKHKLYCQDIGWVKAKDLRVGNALGHLCRSRRGAKYAGVHLSTSPNKQKDQVMEHKLVFGPHKAGMNVHHLDRNTYNNSINNLVLLSHNDHARLIATENNPQTHQVRNDLGKFISGKNSKKETKTIVNLPEHLKTKMLSRFHNCIVSIEEGETTDVYDIQVENTHCVIANNIVAHNCGEIFMSAYDACRLILINLLSLVDQPFTKEANIDYPKLYEIAYVTQKMGDAIVDLEVQHIDRILDKIETDTEPEEVKEAERSLWLKVREITKGGRRTGCGITALGDMLAALNLSYDSEEALEVTDLVMKTIFQAQLTASIDLAEQFGPFEGWEPSLEFTIGNDMKLRGKNDFYQMIADDFPELAARMYENGRRNISWSTVAPAGSVSILTQTTSGIEPLFMPYYMRRKKVNPGDKNVRVDFTDQNGDTWQEYPVVHPQFENYLKIKYLDDLVDELQDKEFLEIEFKSSPWFESTANDIDWKKRVELQGVIQKYTSHSISSTINLPNNVGVNEVKEIYMHSWKKKLKGVTVYRDGSRTGVLVSNTDKFTQTNAPKRPKTLDADVKIVKCMGEEWIVVVGLFEKKPYEVFAKTTKWILSDRSFKGTLTKVKKGKYNLDIGVLEIEDFSSKMTEEQETITRLVSTSLRHGADIKFIVEQLNKTPGTLKSFGKVLARTLKKYIPDGEKVSGAVCKKCNSKNIIYEEGCSRCQECGSSKCG
jgi:ribonucleotide reductase alpha subunit